MVTIGNITVDPPMALSPLSGITDLTFRRFARRFGCPLAFYEMVDANSLYYNREKTINQLLKVGSGDSPIGGQIVGADLERMVNAAKIIEQRGVDLIDINAGCPVKKVVGKKAGGYLLTIPHVLGDMVEQLVKNLSIPVTVKMRMGWDEPNCVEVAKIVEEAGASAVFVHGRSVCQKYKGDVNYDVIRQVKENVKIPVFGSGDVFSANLAEKMMKNTGCDGVIVARGALGNPWIFSQIGYYLKNKTEKPAPYPLEILEVALEHLEMLRELQGEDIAVNRMKKMACWYFSHIKNWQGKKKLNNEFFTMKTTRMMRERLIHLRGEFL